MAAVATRAAASAAARNAVARSLFISNSRLLLLRTFNVAAASLLERQQPSFVRQKQQQRGFSSAAAESLSTTIQKEIAHEKSNYETDKELHAFVQQNNWTLEDKQNDMLVVLTKEVDGRKVQVEFSCIQPSGGEEEEPLPEASDFTVSVQNKNGSGLLFYCSTTSEDENARFCIGQVRYFSDQTSKDSLAEYPGPYFEDLDDAFQQHLDSWLSSLGIDADLCDFIDRFAADKENREYILWLENFQQFIQKP